METDVGIAVLHSVRCGKVRVKHLIRLAAHVSERNQCTAQVNAGKTEALIDVNIGRTSPSGPQTIDCDRRFLQHNDGSLGVGVLFDHRWRDPLRYTGYRHLVP